MYLLVADTALLEALTHLAVCQIKSGLVHIFWNFSASGTPCQIKSARIPVKAGPCLPRCTAAIDGRLALVRIAP